MTPASYQLSLNFDQVLALIKQLPYPEKVLLSQELEKEVLNSQLTALLESFKTSALKTISPASTASNISDSNLVRGDLKICVF